jgi:hypothetical protein
MEKISARPGVGFGEPRPHFLTVSFTTLELDGASAAALDGVNVALSEWLPTLSFVVL